MKRRTAWTACIVVVSSLGIAGMLAGGCGGDDTAPADNTGAGGTAGTSSGAAGTSSGTSGTAGTGGSTGGSAGTAGSAAGSAGTTDSGSDAPVACMPAKVTPTPADKATCQGGLIGDSAASCITTCLCTACPVEALTCLGDPACSAIVACAQKTQCSSVAECLKPEKCGGVLAEAAAGVGGATAFTCCGNYCQTQCAGDGGGTTEAGPKADAPAADAPAADAPASDSTTSDAPAESSSAADADTNEGG